MKRSSTKLITKAGSSKSTSRAKSNKVQYEENQIDCNSSTPTQSKRLELCQLYSPILSQATLEENTNLEVVWDWHSPQSKKCIRKQKRIDKKNSPKLLIKKYPSNNQVTEFDKLNEELKSLTDQIVDTVETNDKKNVMLDSNLDSVFNDSMEAELLVCSQKVEKKFLEKDFDSKVVELPIIGMNNPERILQSYNLVQSVNNNMCSKENNGINNNIAVKSITSVNNKTETLNKIATPNKIADDSFDIALQALGDEDMDFSFTNKKIKTSPSSLDKEEIINSVPASSTVQCTLEEIENKRKLALQKLQKKKPSPSSSETSPIKCSQEEIEKKRLQAIAKLEAKKKQDLIEKNRREALKRLEMNKKKRALQFPVSVQSIHLNFSKK